AAVPRRGSEEPFGRVHEAEPVASGVADPPLVDLRVVARLKPGDAAPFGVMRAAPVHVDLDVAAARAARADRLGGVEVPDAHLEPEVAVGQGADGTDVDHVGGVLVVELSPREEPDLRVVAARSEEHTSELQSLAYLVCRL